MTLQPVIDSLYKIFTDILGFIPRFANGLIILIIGYLISVIVRWFTRLIFKYLHVDEVAERTGINNAMRSLSVRMPVHVILPHIIFFFLLLSFATSAMRLMGLFAIADLLDTILRFIPKAISGALIVIFGSMLAHFLGGLVRSVAENVNITYSNALGRIIEYTIVAFVIVLAISTIGVDTTILTTSLTIIIASAGLAIALTFALGSRESVRHVIAGFYIRQNFPPGQQIITENYRGVVRSTAGAFTVLDVTSTTGERSIVSLPNGLLLQSPVFGQNGTTGNETNPPVGETPQPPQPPQTPRPPEEGQSL